MGFQDLTIKRDIYQNNLLDLEKKYFYILERIFTSKDFLSDLLLIEKEIREKYNVFDKLWLEKNKLNVCAERVVRHYLYVKMHSIISSIYPSPISPDFAVRTNDVVLCVDIKTIDTHNNSGDLRSTAVERNQTSFDNRNYKFAKALANLDPIDYYSGKPVLTYIIKLVYRDDRYSFGLERSNKPGIVLCCIPNGKLSILFDYNIVDNFKTYTYLGPKDDVHYEPINIPNLPRELQLKVIEKTAKERGMNLTPINLGISSKIAYFDQDYHVVWWQTSIKKNKVLRPVDSGSTVRFNNDFLRKRYDSKNIEWEGYKEYKYPDPIK